VKHIETKIQALEAAQPIINQWKELGKSIVFTNGCFDIFHYGHLHLLYHSKQLGDKLIVGINNDSSIKKIKGPKRPIQDQNQRSTILSAIVFVDMVILFEEKTPIKMIKKISPNFLTKGGDYSIDEVVGKKEVVDSGGKIVLIPLVKNLSSSKLIYKLQNGQ
tara:strand:+ start:3021 stop:3506 length:486 start_codon:yes stop_codon:yes gene_type:complete